MSNAVTFGVRALVLVLGAAMTSAVHAATEQFEVQGLVSPASPKALITALEKQLPVKVVGIDIRDTASGWPVIRVEFEAGTVTREQIEQAIGSTEDPTGRKYKVHKGPATANVALLEEETRADGMLGDAALEVPQMKNPVAATPESVARGNELYAKSCAKCHGMDGDGTGPSTHGFTADPRKLWAWSGADDSADGYLFSFITNGRTDMPPWGLVLSETERWDLVNFIKALKAPGQ